jgi:hypothetical protein
MYIPFLISLTYIYFAAIKTTADQIPKRHEFENVLQNLVITEMIYLLGRFWLLSFYEFSLLNFLAFSLVQDIYFYLVHYILHKYLYFIHKQHHSVYGPMHAWHCYWVEHIILNIGSVGIPFMLFPNPSWFLLLITIAEIYTSVNGHTNGSPHHKHHLDITKRLGSIYLIDRLMKSY